MKICWAVFLIVFSCAFVYADSYKIPNESIAEYNIDFKSINPIAISNGATYFVATERVYDVQKIASGNVYNLVVFHFRDKKIVNVDRIPLQIYHLVNVAYDAGSDVVYVFGDRGNKIIQVWLKIKKQRTIFEYKKGREGFKAGPFAFCHKGLLYATGWFYDEDRNWLGDFVVEVQVSKEGKVRFVRKASLDYLFKSLYSHKGVVRNNYYVSGDVFFFNLILPEEKQFELVEFRNQKIRTIAKGYMIYIFCGTEDRSFYVVKNDDDTFDHYVRDLHSEKKWKVGDAGDVYTYPFLVEDRLVVTKMNYDMKTFNAYVGVEKEHYLLKRFIRNASFGAMKISDDAKYYFLMNIEGFQIGTLVD